MDGEATKVLLVAIGGIIGVGGALLSSWLTAHLSDKRARRERRQRLLELIGRRRAISARTPHDGDGEPPPYAADELREWLKEAHPSPDSLAFMTGFVEANTEQFEALTKEAEAALKEAKSLTAKSAGERVKMEELTAARDALLRDRDRLRLVLAKAEDARTQQARAPASAPASTLPLAKGTDAE